MREAAAFGLEVERIDEGVNNPELFGAKVRMHLGSAALLGLVEARLSAWERPLEVATKRRTEQAVDRRLRGV